MTFLAGEPVAAACAAVLLSLIVPQVLLTAWFAAHVRRRSLGLPGEQPARPASPPVPAEVVLCLRGADEQLPDVFRCLARQRYAEWRLRVIVDSVADPAWPVAHDMVAGLGGNATWCTAVIEPLAARPDTGSLKCASLRQALLTLAPQTRVVAVIDADAVPHEAWLASMVEECQREGVGAVSGNRWYEPQADSLAGTVRRLWNAGAIVQMTAFGIPWGGALAVRREAIEACGWTDVIRGSLCEDTALAAPLALAGWRHRFVPGLIAVSDDDRIGTWPLTRWISRQLLTARLHHPLWPLVAVHGLATSAALVVAGSLAALAAWQGRPQAAAAMLLAVAVYEAVCVGLVLVIERAVAAAVSQVGRVLRPVSMSGLLWQAAVLPVTQAVYAVATLMALGARSVEWRGVVYDIVQRAGRAEVRRR